MQLENISNQKAVKESKPLLCQRWKIPAVEENYL